MRDRLKRRKKEPDKAGTEAAPAPLQPSFYDTEPGKEAPPAQESKAEEIPEAEAPRAQASPEAPQVGRRPPGGDGERQRGRRRRTRGGRGRGGTGAPRVPSVPVSGEAPAAISPGAATASDQTATSATAQAAAPRPPRGTVVLAIGLPGSGKSSWFKRHKITPLSSDLLRALLFDDPTEQRFQDLVFSNLRSMLKARLIARRPVNYVDATNLTPREREGWIKLAKDYAYEVQAVFFDVPVEVCLERNRKRERVVPEDAMRRMAGKLKPPAFEEGFSKITVVRVKQKE